MRRKLSALKKPIFSRHRFLRRVDGEETSTGSTDDVGPLGVSSVSSSNLPQNQSPRITVSHSTNNAQVEDTCPPGPSRHAAGGPETSNGLTRIYPNGQTRGLQVVYDTMLHGIENVIVDVILIHGLNGDSYRTWRHKGDESDVFWPVDLLPKDIPNARVLTFGYDVDIIQPLGTSGKGGIHSHALSLVSEIAALRSTDELRELRKIVIIAHSLGGLVAKRAICISAQSAEDSHKYLDASTVGLLFLGTPHKGSLQADYGDILARIVQIAALNLKPVNRKAIGVLKSQSQVLEELQWSFGQWLRKNDDRVSVTCFYEAHEMPNIGLVVPQISATLDGYNALAIGAHHAAMQKFRRKEDPGYAQVSGELRTLCSKFNTLRKEVSDGGRHQEANLLDDTKHDDDIRRESELKKRRQDYAIALSFRYMNSREDSIARPAMSTCEWIFQDETYCEWLLRGKDIIWITGHPGTGKSTLMKHAICESRKQDNIVTKGESKVTLSFFFYNLGTSLQRSIQGCLRSLLHQLLRFFPDNMMDLVDELHQLQLNTDDEIEFTTEKLMDGVESTLKSVCQTSEVRIFLDALDECRNEMDDAEDIAHDARHLISWLKDLEDKLEDTSGNLSICFACRHYPKLARQGLDKVILVEMNSQDDIKHYFDRQLDHVSDRNELFLKKGLRDMILRESKGNFLWVKLVTNRAFAMYDEGDSETKIITAVNALPKGLANIYQAIMQTILGEKRAMSLKFFQILCFAEHPLLLESIRSFLNTELASRRVPIERTGTHLEFIENKEQMRRLVPALSGGMATLKDGKASLIHQSVKDFLLATGLRILDPESQNSREATVRGHSFMLEACFRGLSCMEFGSIKDIDTFVDPHLVIKTTFQDQSLTPTAPRNSRQPPGFDRLQKAMYEESASTQGLKLVSLGSIRNFLRRLDDQSRSKLSSFYHFEDEENTEPLLLAILGFQLSCEQNDNIYRGYCQLNWLHHATHLLNMGAYHAVKSLLKELYSTANTAQLIYLETRGFLLCQVAKSPHSILLKDMARLGTSRGFAPTCLLSSPISRFAAPLLSAMVNGGFENVTTLCEIDKSLLDKRDYWGKSLLHVAATYGEDSIVEFCLKNGVHVDLEDHENKTALYWAVDSWRNDTVKLLLHNKSRDNISSSDRSSLELAILRGNVECFETILKHYGSQGIAPFCLSHKVMLEACAKVPCEMIHSLLRHGLWTQFSEKRQNSNVTIFQELLEAAIQEDQFRAVKLLTRKGECFGDARSLLDWNRLLFKLASNRASRCTEVLMKDYGWRVHPWDNPYVILYKPKDYKAYVKMHPIFHSPIGTHLADNW